MLLIFIIRSFTIILFVYLFSFYYIALIILLIFQIIMLSFQSIYYLFLTYKFQLKYIDGQYK